MSDQNADYGREPRVHTIGDLFPPDGHRYLTDERIEAIRLEALSGAEHVVLSPRLALELVCDWRNMAAQIDRSGES